MAEKNTKIAKPQLIILNIHNKLISIRPHNNLQQNLIPQKEMTHLTRNLTWKEFNYTYPPIIIPDCYNDYIKHTFPSFTSEPFLTHEDFSNIKAYVLVARQWSYAYLIEQSDYILFALYRSEEEARGLIAYDPVQADLLKYAVDRITVNRKPSKTAAIRHNKVGKGIECPVCHYSLNYRRDHQKPDQNGMHEVACFNVGQGRCLFVLKLTQYEYALFKQGKLRTVDMLVLLPDAFCSECNANSIYVRTLRISADIIITLKICINRCREVPACNYADPGVDHAHVCQIIASNK